MNRRECMTMAARLGLALPAAMYLGRSFAQAEHVNRAPIVLRLDPQWRHEAGQIADRMTGLSYESAQLGDPGFFSPQNKELIALFKQLSPNGTLRLGGNLSEYTRWSPQPSAHRGPSHLGAVAPDAGKFKTHPEIVISQEAIDNLSGFLRETGWSVIYGLGLAKAVPDRAAAEAKYVFEALGENLLAFQIGNEPNHYVMNGLRAKGYDFADYFHEWSSIHAAVLAQVPQAQFGGPDVAEGADWIAQFAKVAPKSVVMLTGHHYAEGPPTSPSANIQNLLAPQPEFALQMESIRRVASEAGLPFLMTETNSCFNSGKPGVSNVFASALWAINYIFALAQDSVQAVCFHGGADAWYTPIAGGGSEPFTPRPIYYGIEFCRSLLGEKLSRIDVAPEYSRDVAAYALDRPRKVLVVNHGSVDALVRFAQSESVTQVERLVAPSLLASKGIRILSERPEAQAAKQIHIPRYSAAILSLDSL